MKSKKCDRCGFVSGETAGSCKGCGASFTNSDLLTQPVDLRQPASEIVTAGGLPSLVWSTTEIRNGLATGLGNQRKKLAQMSLAAAGGALVWSRLREQIGLFSDLLAIVLLVTGIVLAIVALFKIRKNPFLYGGKRFAQVALAASGLLILLYAMAVPAYVAAMFPKAIKPVWRQYESDGGKFTVRIPGEPHHLLFNFEAQAGPVPWHTIEIDLGSKGACIAGYADFTGYILKGSVETMLDAAAEAAYKREEMTLISKKSISLHGYEGRELLLQLSPTKYGKDAFAIARIYLAFPRLYVNIIGGPNSSEIYQDRFKFLDSFRILSTPLIEAAERGQTSLLRNLLAESTDEKEKDVALVRAAKSGSLVGVRALFDAGVRINAKDDSDRTALMMAAGYSTPVDDRVVSCVTFLISAGADLNAQDPDHQWSALTWSIMEGNGNAAIPLIKAGADVNLRDRTGETALTHAKTLGRPDVIEALEKAGARE
jgi:hypothetical protein